MRDQTEAAGVDPREPASDATPEMFSGNPSGDAGGAGDVG
jgi:hypothetical protein